MKLRDLTEMVDYNDEDLQYKAERAMEYAVAALSRQTDDVTKEAVMAWLEPRVDDDVYRMAHYLNFGGKI